MTKILIVDDDESARYMMRMMLRNHATQLLEALNASAALLAIQEHKPDIIIFDIVMPGTINGIQACEMVKSNLELVDSFVIIISGRDTEQDFADAKRAGANAYFVKPFRLSRLVEVVSRYKAFESTFLLEKLYF